jgi:hypothetical protein
VHLPLFSFFFFFPFHQHSLPSPSSICQEKYRERAIRLHSKKKSDEGQHSTRAHTHTHIYIHTHTHTHNPSPLPPLVLPSGLLLRRLRPSSCQSARVTTGDERAARAHQLHTLAARLYFSSIACSQMWLLCSVCVSSLVLDSLSPILRCACTAALLLCGHAHSTDHTCRRHIAAFLVVFRLPSVFGYDRPSACLPTLVVETKERQETEKESEGEGARSLREIWMLFV